MVKRFHSRVPLIHATKACLTLHKSSFFKWLSKNEPVQPKSREEKRWCQLRQT
jgi:hypothetical protein